MSEWATRAMCAGHRGVRAARRWGAVGATLMVATLASAAPPAYQPPSEAALKRWETRFRPGLYEVREFALDAAGQPVEKGARTTQACLEKAALSKIARFPIATAALWQCQPLRATLETASLAVAMGCPASGKDAQPLGAMALVRWVGPNEFETVAQKFELDKNGTGERVLLSEGSSLTRLGSCQ